VNSAAKPVLNIKIHIALAKGAVDIKPSCNKKAKRATPEQMRSAIKRVGYQL
jgi:hypothetical protein